MDAADFETPAGDSHVYVVPWREGQGTEHKGCLALDSGLGTGPSTVFLGQWARIHLDWFAKSIYLGTSDEQALTTIRGAIRTELDRSLLMPNRSSWSEELAGEAPFDFVADVAAVMRHLSKAIPLGDNAGIRVSLVAAIVARPKHEGAGAVCFATHNDEFNLDLRIVSSIRPGEKLLHVRVVAPRLKGTADVNLPISVRVAGERCVGVGRALVVALSGEGESSAVIPVKEHDLDSSVLQVGPAWRADGSS